jgi:L-lactate dehydrogenase complex protein LldE
MMPVTDSAICVFVMSQGQLLRNVKGLEFVEMTNADVCCGFGGTFSVKYPEISAGILDNKIEAIQKANVATVVSGDSSC